MADLNQISEMLQKGKAKEVERLVAEALAEGVPVKEILEKGLISGMGVIGGKFKNNQVYVPEVLIAARAMNKGMAILEPAMIKAGVEPLGTVVIGTVRGDLHDIGKNLVCMMFKGAGFKVVDLGTDVAPEKFAAAAKENKACIVGLSALLTTTMPAMKECVEILKSQGGNVKVL
ncbi:MAG: cobalamin-dependent protein, partial [Planctomycetota bacterium]|nr:cobalamin-dependent protein [Planctomycetota bacterium]